MNPGGGRPSRAGTETGWYVYGVVPGDTPDEIVRGARGVGEGIVRIVTDGGLGAIVSEVPLAEFGDEPLAANLHDPGWLEARVRGHDDVLGAVVREAPVVPFRFGTIYRSEDQVRAMLARHSRFADALEALRGKVELGVKGFLTRSNDSADDPPEESGATPGRRYLEQKQQARRAAEERDALLAAAADESHARLAAVADDARANPLQPRETTEEHGVMFLNGAYLVRTERERDFRRTLAALEDELRASGIAFALTGPWPAYNFADADA